MPKLKGQQKKKTSILKKMPLSECPQTRDREHNQEQVAFCVVSQVTEVSRDIQNPNDRVQHEWSRHFCDHPVLLAAIPFSSQPEPWLSTLRSTQHQAKGPPVRWEPTASTPRRPSSLKSSNRQPACWKKQPKQPALSQPSGHTPPSFASTRAIPAQPCDRKPRGAQRAETEQCLDSKGQELPCQRE